MTQAELTDYFLEVLDRSGVVSERVSLDDEPLMIGRAYSCQVIIDDPYVCAQHVSVTLQENGELLLEDQGSVNGLSLARHGSKQSYLCLKPGEDCFIGSTKLRFRYRQTAVAPARQDHSRQFIFNALQQPGFVALIIILPFLQLLLFGWLEQARKVEFHSLLIAPASVYVLLIIWAFVWAVAGKLLVHRAMFFTHLAIVTAMIAVTTIVEGITSHSVFIFNVDALQKYIQYVTGILITTAVIYAHLHFASRGKPRSLLSAAAVSAVVLIAVSAYIEFEANSQFSSSPKYGASLKPPMYVIGSLQTSDEFLVDMDSIKNAVDKLKKSEK